MEEMVQFWNPTQFMKKVAQAKKVEALSVPEVCVICLGEYVY